MVIIRSEKFSPMFSVLFASAVDLTPWPDLDYQSGCLDSPGGTLQMQSSKEWKEIYTNLILKCGENFLYQQERPFKISLF